MGGKKNNININMKGGSEKIKLFEEVSKNVENINMGGENGQYTSSL